MDSLKKTHIRSIKRINSFNELKEHHVLIELKQPLVLQIGKDSLKAFNSHVFVALKELIWLVVNGKK